MVQDWKLMLEMCIKDTSCILVSDMEKPNHSEKLRKELQDEKLFQPIVCMLCTGPLHAWVNPYFVYIGPGPQFYNGVVQVYQNTYLLFAIRPA